MTHMELIDGVNFEAICQWKKELESLIKYLNEIQSSEINMQRKHRNV